MKEKSKVQMLYKSPRVIPLDEQKCGLGMCSWPGSGDAGGCEPTGNSAGANCWGGNSATAECMEGSSGDSFPF